VKKENLIIRKDNYFYIVKWNKRKHKYFKETLNERFGLLTFYRTSSLPHFFLVFLLYLKDLFNNFFYWFFFVKGKIIAIAHLIESTQNYLTPFLSNTPLSLKRYFFDTIDSIS
jgi:hypothetical protein